MLAPGLTGDGGQAGRADQPPEGIAGFRAFNYDRIYLRPDARVQAANVIDLLQQLTEWLIHHPERIGTGIAPGSEVDLITAEAVRYVSGMTDRFALNLAVEHLGWSPEKLPRGV